MEVAMQPPVATPISIFSFFALPLCVACGEPNEIEGLQAPSAAEGVQLYSGAFSAPASEDAICFATYYDASASVPWDARMPCGDRPRGQECFTFQRRELAQTGGASRSTATVYAPARAVNGRDWPMWECLGGERNGQSCDPTQDRCGARSACATPIESSASCDYFADPANFDFGATPTEHVSVDTPSEAPSVLPLKGFVVWSSRGVPSNNTVEQWINVYLASTPQQTNH